MNRDKQIEKMQQFVIDIKNSSQKATEIITQETANYVKQNHKYNNIVDYAKAHIKSRYEYEAEFLAELGYRKSADVAREIFEEIEKTLKKNELRNYEPYNVESYYSGDLEKDLGELKKKYTEEGK